MKSKDYIIIIIIIIKIIIIIIIIIINKYFIFLWDMTIQCDHVIEARRPDIVVVVEKETNKAIKVDIASP